jgi:hypothetical protein
MHAILAGTRYLSLLLVIVIVFERIIAINRRCDRIYAMTRLFRIDLLNIAIRPSSGISSPPVVDSPLVESFIFFTFDLVTPNSP